MRTEYLGYLLAVIRYGSMNKAAKRMRPERQSAGTESSGKNYSSARSCATANSNMKKRSKPSTKAERRSAWIIWICT
jgi:hypothetical protein